MKRLLAIILAMLTVVAFSACAEYDDNIDNYYDDVKNYEADLFMPNLDEIDNYEEIDYVCKKDPAFFPSYSLQLVVKYDDETFLREKTRLETAYIYLDEPQKYSGNDSYTMPVETFSVSDFNFKIAKFDNTVYPKNFGMVGVSETKREIAYLWLCFWDLDTICGAEEDRNKAMLEFIDDYFSLE